MKQIDLKRASGMIKLLAESCLSGLVRLGRIRDLFERTIGDLTFWMKPLVKVKIFTNSPGRFFHYELLFTSSFGKNLIMPEAEMPSKV
jgi:hypothetical protein